MNDMEALVLSVSLAILFSVVVMAIYVISKNDDGSSFF